MRVVFFGTPSFSANVLLYLLQNGIEVVAVVTKPDRPQGRSKELVPTAVKQLILNRYLSIPLHQPAIVSTLEFAPTLQQYDADLFVVVAYGEIIKQHLLDMPRLGCINLHTSLLPKYRGAAPIQRSIMEGNQTTGVTIMHMVKKMDAGDVIKCVELPIGENDTFLEIEQNLCEWGSKALLDVIKGFAVGDLPRIPQDHTQATLAPKIELEDCEIHWEHPAKQIHNLIRAVTPEPGAWCYVTLKGQKKRLKIYGSRVAKEYSGAPGTILSYTSEGIMIGCGCQALNILTLQLEGKKKMSAEEFVRGHPDKNTFLFCT